VEEVDTGSPCLYPEGTCSGAAGRIGFHSLPLSRSPLASAPHPRPLSMRGGWRGGIGPRGKAVGPTPLLRGDHHRRGPSHSVLQRGPGSSILLKDRSYSGSRGDRTS